MSGDVNFGSTLPLAALAPVVTTPFTAQAAAGSLIGTGSSFVFVQASAFLGQIQTGGRLYSPETLAPAFRGVDSYLLAAASNGSGGAGGSDGADGIGGNGEGGDGVKKIQSPLIPLDTAESDAKLSAYKANLFAAIPGLHRIESLSYLDGCAREIADNTDPVKFEEALLFPDSKKFGGFALEEIQYRNTMALLASLKPPSPQTNEDASRSLPIDNNQFHIRAAYTFLAAWDASAKMRRATKDVAARAAWERLEHLSVTTFELLKVHCTRIESILQEDAKKDVEELGDSFEDLLAAVRSRKVSLTEVDVPNFLDSGFTEENPKLILPMAVAKIWEAKTPKELEAVIKKHRTVLSLEMVRSYAEAQMLRDRGEYDEDVSWGDDYRSPSDIQTDDEDMPFAVGAWYFWNEVYKRAFTGSFGLPYGNELRPWAILADQGKYAAKGALGLLNIDSELDDLDDFLGEEDEDEGPSEPLSE